MDPAFTTKYGVGDTVYPRFAALDGRVSRATVQEIIVSEGIGPAGIRTARYRLSSDQVQRGCRWLERDLLTLAEAKSLAASVLRKRAEKLRRSAVDLDAS